MSLSIYSVNYNVKHAYSFSLDNNFFYAINVNAMEYLVLFLQNNILTVSFLLTLRWDFI
jgi:hypothetical protein